MMSEPAKITPIRPDAADDRMIVSITVAQLREIIRQEVGASSPTELIDAETVAKKLSIPLSWVYEQSRQGNIPTHRIGKYIRFDIREVLESQQRKLTG